MAVDARNILVTTSRMPFAVDEIRKLGATGHTVVASDTFRASPGSHSRGATRHIVTRSPTGETEEFINDVIAEIEASNIEMVLPMFEEVFYLATHRELLATVAELFFPDFAALALVHNKVTFSQLCLDLGLPVADHVVVNSEQDMLYALERWEQWFARAAYGRGGLDVRTNTGPLADDATLDDVHPNTENPWLVQRYLHGVDRCSWSVAREGRITLHSTYEHPVQIDNRGGIVFESVDAPETLEAAGAIVSELNWTGQISFDFLRTDDGVHYLVECNPRPTAGCTNATAEELDTALFGSVPDRPVVIPAGRKAAIKVALLRDIVKHLSRIGVDTRAARGAEGVYAQWRDPLPMLYSALSLQHVRHYRKALGMDRRSREDLIAAQFYDVLWDGRPIGPATSPTSPLD